MDSTQLETPFDYIVIGGGTAGSVVASRLSEDNVRVLVIEAGPDHSNNPIVTTPGLVVAQYGREEYDWNFSSVPQPALHNRRVNQAKGRQLGGSSALNFMMVLYPSRANIDAWEKLGNDGWSYDSLQPYFRKSSTGYSPSKEAGKITGLDEYHDDSLNGSGPLHVSFGEGYTTTVNGAWMETFSQLGLKMTADPRSGKGFGAFQNPASINPSTKTRSFAASAYLTHDVCQRENLVVLTESVVRKIVTEKHDEDIVATGVVVQTKEGEKTVSAQMEVILAAGALQSPQILELSGIGDRELLKKHGIPLVLENSNVGEHLQDHAIVCQSFEVKEGIPSGDILRDPNLLNAVMQQYVTAGGDGPMGQNTISVAYAPLSDYSGPLSAENKKTLLDTHLEESNNPQHALLRHILEQPDEPAAEYLLFPFQVSIKPEPAHMAEIITPTMPENYMTLMTILNHPFSRGSVHITSSDINVKPEWDPKYLSHPLDMEILARSVSFGERIINTQPFSSVFKQGGKRHANIIGDDLERAKEIVRQRQISVFHVSGSCPMLPRDQGGVVDARLKVYGARNIRVVDASVFPLEPLGNIQSTVYAVAERAADLIKQDRKGNA